MELDQLKNSWQNSNQTINQTSKKKIMELSQQKSYGPIASLKTALGKQIFIIPFLIVILTIQTLTTPDLQTDPFFGLFVSVIVLASVFFIVAYQIINKMSIPDAPVVDQLKRQVQSLQQMLLFYRVISVVGVAILIVFLEAFKTVGTAKLMQPWYDVDIWLRVAAYFGMFVITFFASNSRFNQEFGKHLEEIKKNLSDIE